MEGRAQLRCVECGRTREVSGEIPDEYVRSFESAVREDRFVVRPGSTEMICGTCLMKYVGHESVDDAEKIG